MEPRSGTSASGRLLAVVLGTAVVLGGGCIAGDGGQAPSPGGTQVPFGLKEAKDPDGRLVFGYPDGWKQQKDPGEAALLLSRRGSEDDGFAENVNVVVEELPEGLDLDGYSEAAVRTVRETFGGIDLIDENPDAELGGAPAHRIHYFADQEGTTYQILQIWTVQEGFAFVLTYTGTGADFPEYLHEVDRMIASFRVTA